MGSHFGCDIWCVFNGLCSDVDILGVYNEFRKQVPDSILYLHCAIQDVGWNMNEVIQAIDPDLTNRVIFPAPKKEKRKLCSSAKSEHSFRSFKANS